MSARYVCPVCSAEFDDVETHLAESHSKPDERFEGKPAADAIRAYVARPARERTVANADADTTAAPPADALTDLGINVSGLRVAVVTTETGASLTAPEAKRVMSAIDDLAGFRVDRSSFLVNFVDWGIRNSFSEELAEAGGWSLVETDTGGVREAYFKAVTMQQAVAQAFAEAGTGRDFTFRRFGRYLGPSVLKVIAENPQLKRYSSMGSPMSNRLGVPPRDFLAVCSIFEYIKPYQKWSAQERAAWTAHNLSVVKVSNTGSADFLPVDLRPQPSAAQARHDNRTTDFHARDADRLSTASTFVRGGTLYDKMVERSRLAGNTTGLGRSDSVS